MHIPESYVIQKIFSHAYEPVHQKHSNQYNAGCPVCKEGKHLGKKKRLYYYLKTNTFYCFNCNKKWSALSWLRDACNLSFKEVQDDIISNNYRVDITKNLYSTPQSKKNQTLPHDSINLCDLSQQAYYSSNVYVQRALQLLKDRRLNTAINKPQSFFISLSDFIHKNRLCIPFYDIHNNISFFQTRSLDASLPKYLSKSNSEKKIYGLNNINPNFEYIFIFEGPIDAMFVQNGVAVTGLNLTENQKLELDKLSFYKKIWVLDNQNIDAAAKKKTEELLASRSSVFIWPNNIKCKDFNELSIALSQDSISHKFILRNTKLF